jgi:hypothetical protein
VGAVVGGRLRSAINIGSVVARSVVKSVASNPGYAGFDPAVGAWVGALVGALVGVLVGDGVGAGVSHKPLSLHTPLLQSSPSPQIWPILHRGHKPPPQSISVSKPPRIPSLHDGEVGAAVGLAVGNAVGHGVGTSVGSALGAAVSRVGAAVGIFVGSEVGAAVGGVGAAVGVFVGSEVTDTVTVGVSVGVSVGASVGEKVGKAVGAGVGSLHSARAAPTWALIQPLQLEASVRR